MKIMSFCLPVLYAGFTSIMMIKYQVLDLNMNFMTWGIYFANIFAVYATHLIGKVVDKCLDCLCRYLLS